MADGNDQSSPPSPSWTEGRPSLDSLISDGGGRPSFDPDVTLPLPDDVQAQVDSQLLGSSNGGGRSDAKEGNRLLKLMDHSGNDTTAAAAMTEEEG